MLPLLLLTLLIVDTTKSSELKHPHTADKHNSSPVKTKPGTFTQKPRNSVQTITGPLDKLQKLGYFKVKPDNGTLTLSFESFSGSCTIIPRISTIDPKKLPDGTNTVVFGDKIVPEYHQKALCHCLSTAGINVVFN